MHPLIIFGVCLVVACLILVAGLRLWITHQRETLDRRETMAKIEAHRAAAKKTERPVGQGTGGRHHLIPADPNSTEVLEPVSAPAAIGWPTSDDVAHMAAPRRDDSAMSTIGPRPYARG